MIRDLAVHLQEVGPSQAGRLFYCHTSADRFYFNQSKARGKGQSEKCIMRSKKQTRSLLPGVRRLLDSMLRYATVLADVHPLIVTVTPHREKCYERGEIGRAHV